MFDTIAAISTPLGEGGIGIVRISGRNALIAADKVCRLKKGVSLVNVATHTINYGFVVDPKTGDRIDEVLVSVMLGPGSYTGEDVVEINCHGGIVPVRMVLELVLESGAILAEPGEFSKRAFLNGRIDLAQAEAVIDVIRSRTESGMEMAMRQLSGFLSLEVNNLRDTLLEMIAYIEASIDFPDEDIEELENEEIRKRIVLVRSSINNLLEDSRQGRIYREGAKMVIIGRPNVGKSSLLNALIREKRAIVTEVPGTTRDAIEELINIKGIPVCVVDTAGIRETSDTVEKIGVERTLEHIEKADLVLMILDSEIGLTYGDEEIAEKLGNKPVIFVLNKIDIKDTNISRESLDGIVKGRPLVEISATLEIGLAHLEDVLADIILGGKVVMRERGLVTRMRHVESLRRAACYLDLAYDGCIAGFAPDLLSVDIRGAWEVLGEIIGDTASEEVLSRIFEEFCIGK